MQPSDQSFGELRAILHAEPDERTWSQLCEFFDPFPSDKQETTQVEVMGWQEKLLDYATTSADTLFKCSGACCTTLRTKYPDRVVPAKPATPAQAATPTQAATQTRARRR